MYSVIFTKPALKDIDNISKYIFYKLHNPSASVKLLQEFVKSKKLIVIFPKSNKYNGGYYKYKVKNYYMFYKVDDKNKIINIIRVMYKNRDFQKNLNKEYERANGN